MRELNRNLDFRLAVTSAIDRVHLGQSLVKGPFTTPYAGGIYAGMAFYDKASTVYYPFDDKVAKDELAKAGLKDTDGDGIVNFPKDTPGVGGQDVSVTLLTNADYQTDKSLAEGVVASMAKIGIRVIVNAISGTSLAAIQNNGQWDWQIFRNQQELISVVQNTTALAPVGPQTSFFHRAGTDGTLDLLPFEKNLVDIVNTFVSEQDSAKRVALMKQFQEIYTKNAYAIGLTQYPGALIINKRFDNIPHGTPIFMFNWAEGAVMRERLYVPKGKQPGLELYADTLPGKPGVGNGPVKD